MPEVDTNTVNLAIAREATLGVLPATPLWEDQEPNDIGRFGLVNTLVQRDPISKDRMERAGVLTDADSAVEWEGDWTISAFRSVGEAFVLANFIGPAVFDRTDSLAAEATGYGVAAGGALVADTLVYGRGFALAANNGLKVVDAASTAILIIIVGGLTVEAAPPEGATVEVAGVRGATGDFEIDANGDWISTTLDLTTLSLTVGQIIHIGGVAAANRFAATEDFGPARIVSIATNLVVLENRSQAFSTDDGSTKDIDILFGQFLRPVAVDAGDYNSISFTAELTSPNLGTGGTTRYEYAEGNMMNTIGFNIPNADKCTMTVAAIGTTTGDPTATRDPEGVNSILPVATEGLSSSIDVARLRFKDYDTLGFGSCFKTLDLQISNNVSPEKCIATLGAKGINIGTLNVTMNAEINLSDEQVIKDMNGNETANLDFIVRNADGAMAVDFPAFKLGGGQRSFPRNEKVRLALENRAFKDPILGYPISFSMFPVMPAA